MTTRKPNEVPAALKNVNLRAVLRRSKMYNKLSANKSLKEAALPLAKELLKKPAVKTAPPAPQKNDFFTNEVIQDYWQKQIHMVDVIEDKFEKKVEQFIVKIGDEFLKHLDEAVEEKAFTKFVQKDYFSDNEDDLIVAAQLDFAPLLDTVATLAGNEANKLIGVQEPYIGINFRKQIRQNVERFTKSMLDTDKEHLVNIITHGLESGKSIPEIRSAIQADFDQYSKMQATRITRTEVLRASNQAALDAFKESGVVEGKQWLTAGAIDECAQYEGKIESLDGSFYGSNDEFADGDPPLHPNCRCVLLPVLVGEKAYRPAPIYEKEILDAKIADLEAQVDKRTKAYREIKEKQLEDQEYINELEGLLDDKRTTSQDSEV